MLCIEYCILSILVPVPLILLSRSASEQACKHMFCAATSITACIDVALRPHRKHMRKHSSETHHKRQISEGCFDLSSGLLIVLALNLDDA